MSGDICTVHNGIIENYIDLKSYLKKKSFIFKSDTDSEVICHLINYYYSKSANMQSAIIATANSLEGSYALAAINTQTPHTIYSACKGSPIILGKDVASNYISSDMTAIVDHTKSYIPMDDNEFSEISSSKPKSDSSLTNLKLSLAVFPRSFLILSGSFKPGNSTKILFSPRCKIVGSLVPTSSILRLTISIDCLRAELLIVSKPYFEKKILVLRAQPPGELLKAHVPRVFGG